MIRLTWMQFRLQALVGVAGLAVVAIVLAITGPSLHHLYATSVLDCHANGNCATAPAAFLTQDRSLKIGLDVMVEAVPALIGLFWGAPLIARELETGTFRLAWTATTRIRWVAIKLALVGLASIAIAGVSSLIVTWWSSPLDAAVRTPFASFDQRDLAPLAYAAFAFAVGATAGVLIRKTLPAMALGLAAFVGCRLVVAHFVRPHLLAASRLVARDVTLVGSSPGGVSAPNPRDWVISDQTIDAHGQVIGAFGAIGNGNASVEVTTHGVALGGGYTCPSITAPHGPIGQAGLNALIQRCVDQLHIREALTYQPIEHYWPLQWYESAIFLGAAVGLCGFCLCWVQRRLV